MTQKKLSKTRELIISTALEQSATVGLEGVSLGGIATAVNMSKSGLFAHFKSKEALQLAVVEAALDRFQTAVIKPAMNTPKGLVRLRALFDWYLDWMAGAGSLATCPFTVFIQEYDDRPGPVRDLLVKSEQQWRETFSKVAAEAILLRQIQGNTSATQITFELIGVAFSYQVSLSLLATKEARQQAEDAFDRIVVPNQARR